MYPEKVLDFWESKVYNTHLKGDIMNSQKKMGRPTDNPKTKQIMVRLDQKCQDILDRYCKQENISSAEAARRGIMKLEEEIK